MLSPGALEAWCSGIGISSHARALMDRIRTSDPARRVGGGRSNVSGRYPSRKMGVTIQFESHRVELAAFTCWTAQTGPGSCWNRQGGLNE